MKTLLVIGAGGHGKVVADTAREMAEWDRIVFVDARFPELKKCGSWPVISQKLSLLPKEYDGSDFIVAVGDNSTRLKLFNESKALGFNPVNIVHPRSYISSDNELAKGIVFFANSVVNIGSKLGATCIVNTGATIDHDCELADGVHISPGVHLSGGVVVGKKTWIGIGASVKQLVSIGDDVTVGAGAAVVANVRNGVTVVGVPAKEL